MRTGTLAFVAGAALALHLPVLPITAILAGLLASLAIALRCPRLRILSACAAGLLWTALAALQAVGNTLDPEVEARDLLVSAVVADVPDRRAGRLRLLLRLRQARLADGAGTPPLDRLAGRLVRVSWYGSDATPAAGETWRLRVRLRRPRGFANPGAFDYEGWAARNRIAAVGYVRADPGNASVRGAPAWSVAAARGALAAQVDEALGTSPAGAIVKALALGLRGDLSAAQWSTLRDTGTAHLMAISGLHVGLVAWFAYACVRVMWSRSTACIRLAAAPHAALFGAVAAAAGYAALAGFTVPTRRAVLMLGVLALARLRGRNVPPSVLLAAACVIMLVGDPLSVGSGGFWLSFIAVAAILAGASGRLGASSSPSRGAGMWWRWGRIHVVVALGIAPASLALFGETPVLAPIANAIAVPWVSMIVVPGALAGVGLGALVPSLGGMVLTVVERAVELLWPALELIEAHGISVRAASPPAFVLAAAGIGCLLALAPLPALTRAMALCWLMPALLWRPAQLAPGAVEVAVLDVGQGLAVVARTRRRVLVYDTGPRWRAGFDAGRDVVARYLGREGVEHVDMLIVSHGDADHAGGAPGLRRTVRVREVVSDAERIRGPKRGCRPGRSWRWDGIDFALLRAHGTASSNDRSCVLRIIAPGGMIVLPGDAERAAERALIGPIGAEAPVALLVAGHHGSRTSSSAAFVEALRPRRVAISAGHRNRFGFPHPEVVERFSGLGSTLHATSVCGAIVYRIEPSGDVRTRCTRERERRPWRTTR